MDYTKRVHRLLRIITLVQSRRAWTPKRLAEELAIAERTLYRDLDDLKAAGIPIHFDRQTSQYCITGQFFMPPVQLTVEEGLSLAALCEHIGGAEQIPFLKSALRALQKIESQLPSSVQEELAEHARGIAIRTAAAMPPDGHQDVYDRMRAAIANRRRLLCKYDAAHSSGSDEQSDFNQVNNVAGSDACDSGSGDEGDAEFEFCPYALFFSVRAWYAIGQRSDRDELRCLKLSRFTKVVPTDRPYMIPDDFSVECYLGNAWRMMRGQDYQVELWFDAEFAQTVSDTLWHRTQEIDWHDDGSCTFRCTVSGLDEIEWWVLSMGPHCVVKQPIELAERVRDLAARTAAQYENR